jgi:hypothetical protein
MPSDDDRDTADDVATGSTGSGSPTGTFSDTAATGPTAGDPTGATGSQNTLPADDTTGVTGGNQGDSTTSTGSTGTTGAGPITTTPSTDDGVTGSTGSTGSTGKHPTTDDGPIGETGNSGGEKPSLPDVLCPFNRATIGSPCDAADCENLASDGCKTFVYEYCSKHSGDTGCIYIVDPGTDEPCPFNANVAGSPCKAAVCDHAGSDACKSLIVTHCTEHPTDIGCTFVTVPSGGNGGSKPTNSNCPFSFTHTESPCNAEICKLEKESIACRTVISSYCKLHSKDRGCFFVSSDKSNDAKPVVNDQTGTASERKQYLVQHTIAVSGLYRNLQ